MLIDAGTGVGDLTLDELRRIDHVSLTRSQMDHIAALPLLLDSVGSLRTHPVQVHALAEPSTHCGIYLKNDVIWPDFSALPSAAAPYVEFVPFALGKVVTVQDLRVEALPALHNLPAVGFALNNGDTWWVSSGDAEDCPAFWEPVNALDVDALVIESAFTNADEGVACASRHLWPEAFSMC